jgi:hypothetical protein
MMFLAWWGGRRPPLTTTFRFDPQADTTIDLAIGFGLCAARSSGRLVLTERGIAIADELLADEQVFEVEKAFLDSLPRSITETVFRQRLGWS